MEDYIFIFKYKNEKMRKNNAEVPMSSHGETEEWVDVLPQIYGHYWLDQWMSWP